MRNFLSVIAGLIIGIIVVNLIDALREFIYPPRSYLDYGNENIGTGLVVDAPFGAKLFIPLAWALGSFFGGLVSSLISNNKKVNVALITGFILMMAGLKTLITFYHPIWVWIVGLSVFLPSAYLGAKLGILHKKNHES